jgi:hypothetical protein
VIIGKNCTSNRDINGTTYQTKECLGPSGFHDFKVPKEKVNIQKLTTLCNGPIQVVLYNSDWYKDNQATGILTKFKIKKIKDLFI